MKNKLIISFALTLLVSFLFSCDKVEQPLKDGKNPWLESTAPIDTVVPEVPIRKILVEDYTGQACSNCPQAANEMITLGTTYGNNIIPIAIHATFFARPTVVHDIVFDADYRTVAGNELDAEYGFTSAGLPNGLINRKEFGGNLIQPYGTWSANINSLLEVSEEATIAIAIENTFDEASRKVDIKVSADILAYFPGNLNVCVYFIEDNIVSPQVSASSVIENYTHRHMLRLAVNGAFGTLLATSATEGETLTREFTFNADEAWNMANGEIVAFISDADTNEVIQVESAHVISNH